MIDAVSALLVLAAFGLFGRGLYVDHHHGTEGLDSLPVYMMGSLLAGIGAFGLLIGGCV